MNKIIKIILYSIFYIFCSCEHEETIPNSIANKPEQFQDNIPTELKLKHIESNDTIHFLATDYWEVIVTDTLNPIWLTVEPATGGPGSNILTFTAQENTTERERIADVTIRCGDKKESIIVKQEPAPVIYYFNEPWNGYERGLIKNNGRYFLVYKDSTLSDFLFFMGDTIGNNFITCVDTTGLIRQFVICDTVYDFEFNDNDIDVYITAGDSTFTIKGISYDDFEELNNPPPFIYNKATIRTRSTGNEIIQPWYDASSTILGIAGVIENAVKDGGVSGTTRVAGLGSILSLASIFVPNEHPIVKDLLNVEGATISIIALAAIIPEAGTVLGIIGGVAATLTIGEFAWRRLNFGNIEFRMNTVNPLSCTKGLAIATLTGNEDVPFMNNKTLSVRFIVNGPDKYQRTYRDIVINDTCRCDLTFLKPETDYSCRARLHKSWIENSRTRQRFGFHPYLLGYNKMPEGFEYHQTIYSLDGGAVNFRLPPPVATTGDVISQDYDGTVRVECSFELADDSGCGVTLLNTEGQIIDTYLCFPIEKKAYFGGLKPVTKYYYYAYVKCNDVIYKGEIKSFTTYPPSFAGTWSCVENRYDNLLKKEYTTTYTINLLENGKVEIIDSNSSKPEDTHWIQGNLHLSIYVTDYTTIDYGAGKTWSGDASIDNYNRIEGYNTVWRYHPNGSNEGDAISFVMTRQNY